MTALQQDHDVVATRSRVAAFAHACRRGLVDYGLSPQAESTPYARCFGIFCRRLCRDPFEPAERQALADAAVREIRALRQRRECTPDGKPYRQLLAFTLSALAALDELDLDPLADLIEEQVPRDLSAELNRTGALDGKPGSGNQAMFLAIFLIHARDRLHLDIGSRLDEWIECHLARMNRFGFWGRASGMTHLHFQNGYHQYEILEYLRVANPRATQAVAAVRALADPAGHFAPYPGGGGCFDYDAVFVLTPDGRCLDETTSGVLRRTAATIASEQQPDGGFAESLQIRPRSARALRRVAAHMLRGISSAPLLMERMRHGVAIQRPRHDRIHTHWSQYSRGWGESNLWDSWFRLMALARIEAALDPSKAPDWGFIDYPGIGHHASLRAALHRT